VLELATGALLAFFYAPSAHTAWASTVFIQDQLTLGWFVRGLHSFGASTMVVAAGLHFLHVLFAGAYKAPREGNWVVGLGPAAAHRRVLHHRVRPALGPEGLLGQAGRDLDRRDHAAGRSGGGEILQGGPAYGNYTVTHLFGFHAFVLPAVTVALVVLHIALVRRHRLTPPWT
jgi:ubiquinol-cytochrome c reductase cytochrome b subunit